MELTSRQALRGDRLLQDPAHVGSGVSCHSALAAPRTVCNAPGKNPDGVCREADNVGMAITKVQDGRLPWSILNGETSAEKKALRQKDDVKLVKL
jgi:hypothetical protein